MIRVTVSYNDRQMQAFINNLPGLREDYSEHVARQIEFVWRQQAHQITGAYKASLYVSTHTESEYAGAVAQATALNPKGDVLPEIAKPPEGGAAVSSCLGYPFFEEYGNAHRPGHPAFTPAVQSVRARMPSIKEVYKV